ncbi:MAG: lytic transglycosylase domain-containing protein [bacterium]|nr:lytic transglycosylase domain-containing protein [bacterium]
MLRLLVLTAAFALSPCLLAPSAVRAELVVFADGGFLKVEDFRLEGDRVRLDLPSGGRLVVSILRVARILEDEVGERLDQTPEEGSPGFDLAFDPAQPRPATPFADLIWGAGERHALNPALLAAVVRAESAFDPRAVSHKGAQGLMQLMPATAQRFGLRGAEVFKPEKNIDAGARYLSWLAGRYEGDLASVLAAYNSGEGTVDRYRGVPPYRETRSYLKRIYAELGLDEGSWAAASSAGR